jgi:hypothetical protein
VANNLDCPVSLFAYHLTSNHVHLLLGVRPEWRFVKESIGGNSGVAFRSIIECKIVQRKLVAVPPSLMMRLFMP